MQGKTSLSIVSLKSLQLDEPDVINIFCSSILTRLYRNTVTDGKVSLKILLVPQ